MRLIKRLPITWTRINKIMGEKSNIETGGISRRMGFKRGLTTESNALRTGWNGSIKYDRKISMMMTMDRRLTAKRISEMANPMGNHFSFRK
jgi:hypothetical protein